MVNPDETPRLQKTSICIIIVKIKRTLFKESKNEKYIDSIFNIFSPGIGH